MRRFTATTLLALIITGSLPLLPRSLPLPDQRVHAQFVVVDADASRRAVVKAALDVTLATLKKRLLDFIVDEIVVWIQGGGKPLFVTDWRAFLAQYGNIVTGDIVMSLGLGAVCSPFGFQLQLAVMAPPRFSSQVTCTLDKIVGNMVAFYNNFRTGGFIAYQEMWQPKNNFYGALLLAMDEKEVKTSDRRYAALQEAQAGAGFLGTKKCDGAGHCFITTPGMTVGAMTAKAMGTNIDWLMSSDTMAEYVAAIADALINRLIKEGVSGIQRAVAENAPPIGYIPQAPKKEKPCDRLLGQDLAACEAALAQEAGNVTLLRSSYANLIDATLVPLADAQRDLLAMGTTQQMLVSRVSEVNNCQIGRNTPGREDTVVELTLEQKTLADMNNAIQELQAQTVPLVNARAALTTTSTTDIVTLNNILTPIYPLLSQARSESYRTSIGAQSAALAAKSAKRLPELQTLLNQCLRL